MPKFSADGVEIYYEVTGKGYPLVWSHESGDPKGSDTEIISITGGGPSARPQARRRRPLTIDASKQSYQKT